MENISLLGRLVLAGRPALARARVPGTTRLLERGLSKAQGRSVVTLPSKVRMDIDFADRVQRAEAFWAYESGELRALGRLVRPGDIVLDLGGHVGYHALHLARAVGRAGKVLTFEPNPANLVQLRRNIALNPELPIQVVAAAAGRAGGTAAFGPV
ncbi:MAG: FkbM family methyltransferase, partial [Actinomycetota bacterium]